MVKKETFSKNLGTAYSCHWKIKFGAEWGIGHDWKRKKISPIIELENRRTVQYGL
jgi:hypothetical protein